MASSSSGLPASARTRMFRPHITGSLSSEGSRGEEERGRGTGVAGERAGGRAMGAKWPEGKNRMGAERKETRVKQGRDRFHGLLTGRKKFQARRCCPPVPDEL